MSTEHVIITDPQIHEPKGVSSAAVDNILVANGAGSSSWQPITDVVADAYAKINIISNTTVIVVPTAVDSTLHTATDYVDATNLFSEDIAINMVVNPTTKLITLPVNGIYRINAWVSVSSSTANAVTGFSMSVNAVSVASMTPVVKVKMKTAGDIGAIAGFGVNTFSAGDELGLVVADDTGANITIHEGNFSVTLLRKS